VVLSGDDTIVIEMVKTSRNEKLEADAVFDGGEGITLRYGDRIEIRRSQEVTNLIKLSTRSFLSTLHKKLSS
jgi:NAD+ kinase